MSCRANLAVLKTLDILEMHPIADPFDQVLSHPVDLLDNAMKVNV